MTSKNTKSNKPATQATAVESTYEEDLAKAVAQVMSEEITAEQAVEQVLAEWDVEKGDVLSAIQAAKDAAEQAKELADKQAAEEAAHLKAEQDAAKPPTESVSSQEKVTQQKSSKKPTVTVVVPKGFKLRVDHDTVVDYPAGTQEMPPEHADHWYSKANGVKKYQPQ